jgi:hypothetical protein
MLHPIPESKYRLTMMRIVALQRRLIRALCDPTRSGIPDEKWLGGIWPEFPPDWITEFWTKQKGVRAKWIKKIAAASKTKKKQIIALIDEQLDFRKMYDVPAGHRLTQQNWRASPMAEVQKLMESFYSPVFYAGFGYPALRPQYVGVLRFSKDVYLAGMKNDLLQVCPYCDNFMQKCELDHFFPKSQFPFLTCHPDNLIASCTDSNSITHKGRREPLTFTDADQVSKWFGCNSPSATQPFAHIAGLARFQCGNS